jgi:hypothetical protein
MDDCNLTNLNEAKNEWAARLVSTLAPCVVDGVQTIFKEAWRLCVDSGETSKYLMTFQNLLNVIPSWNKTIIEDERKRIEEKSKCNYLGDLITCVHIIQLKCLTSIRAGNRQKKIDITIPNLDTFIHKVYIQTARCLYKNVYLFEINVTALQKQRNNHELTKFVEECIIKTVRESIPTEEIIRAYLDESTEEEEEVIIEPIKVNTDPIGLTETSLGVFEAQAQPEPATMATTEAVTTAEAVEKPVYEEPKPPEVVPSIMNTNDNETPVVSRLTFSDIDSAVDVGGKTTEIHASKDIDRLEDLSISRSLQNQMSNLDDLDISENPSISLLEPIDISELGIETL